ncbi:HAD family hydrolase [Paenibacillus doosanensis]|uniref:Phosphatase YwpJ n=1 Tax=Paenibacillus konkukensis TaxID=2020716 RepID=A0ABY4RML5_9BACL|nr:MULTISPECIES: HAD family hydrolase [Paenibacillus]MCS7463498.1 HAD family hydrolase [Paenibacillus doosanensis]UQZ83418.1 Putative phosphatase YwpJ [Paenibacillus konkukensis]
MKNILLISDLDGTLLNQTQQISPENESAIRRFMEMGGLFTLATGRMEAAVEPFVRKLGLELPVILYNGAKIVRPATNEVLYERRLTVPPGIRSLLMASLPGPEETALLVYRDGQVYAPARNEVLERHERKDGVVCLPWNDEMMDGPVTKLMLISASPEKMKGIEQAIRDSAYPCELVYSESNYLEILPPHTTKGSALTELIRLLQLDKPYTIAVGDNLNDLAMIRQADLGYAVANAHPELAAAADAVTVHHERHAIAAIIGDFIEKRRELA